MEALEFIAILATFAVALFWYIQNTEAGSDGARGLLAISSDPDAAGGAAARDPDSPDATRASYRIKKRLAMRAHERRDAASAKTQSEAAPAFRLLRENERMRRKFRRQDEARYRVKDKAAKHHPRGGPAAP